MPIDVIGQTYTVGDFVSYPVATSENVRVGIVTGIRTTEHNRTTYQRQRYGAGNTYEAYALKIWYLKRRIGDTDRYGSYVYRASEFTPKVLKLQGDQIINNERMRALVQHVLSLPESRRQV